MGDRSQMVLLEQAIIDWVNDRPMWQRAISAKIVAGENVDQSWIDSFAESVVIGEVTDVERELTVKDLPSSSSAGSRVVLKSIGHLENVNAILAGEMLTFGAAGLTAIYGDNGSGKSGYARLIKEVVGARHHQDVLPNVFSSKPNQSQAAKLSYEVDGDEREGGWPALSDLDLRQIHFYDEACGDDYLATETELAYRPSALNLFDRLIAVTDQVRAAVDIKLSENAARAVKLPALTPGTEAQLFLAKLSAKTTDADIDASVSIAGTAEEQLADLIQEEARLKSTDPTKEKARLLAGATQIEQIADRFDDIDGTLSATQALHVETMLRLLERFEERRNSLQRLALRISPFPVLALKRGERCGRLRSPIPSRRRIRSVIFLRQELVTTAFYVISH
ncbi:hypothetical protein [Arthrobacter sp. MA-N2]|uniref:hypothetical protein n=1 Tax=Arthrobacter sp. MA-N2 TaxID=1101188 RepID=UPI00048251DA|nr:hypothetical protein [Arthrobacter sp. MA-N2]